MLDWLIKDKKDIQYFPDGSISYECQWAIVPAMFEHLHPNRICFFKHGISRIRIDRAVKYKKDGSVRWELFYDEYGSVIDA
jgi:hypothetical protein